MLTRVPGWEIALDRFVTENRAHTFAYGTWDCGLFAAGAIQAMTGMDLAASYRGRYRSARGAVRVAGTVERVAVEQARLHAMPEVAPLCASRGDLVLVANPPREDCLGMVALDGRTAWIAGGDGILSVPMSRVVRAWRV